MLKNLLIACACFCLIAGALRAQAEDREFLATARKTQQTYGNAVVSVCAVQKTKIKGLPPGASISGLDNEEQKVQCSATVIDPSGLALTSLTNLNAQRAMPSKLRVGELTLEVECKVQEVKYRLSDGTELPARIVLKDEDLDLAFLAPQKPLDEPTRSKLAVIPLTDSTPRVEVLDPTIMLSRADANLNFAPILEVGRIKAVLSQPRTCYIGDKGEPGTPVFDRQGSLLGIVCVCMKNESSEGTGTGSSTMMSPLGLTTRPVILPAAEIARFVPQAKEEAKKVAEAKPQ